MCNQIFSIYKIDAWASLTHWLTYQNSKVLPEDLENRKFAHLLVLVYNRQKKSKNPTFGFPSIRKKFMKMSAILYNSATADRIRTGFSLNNSPKRAENTPGWHDVRNSHRSRDTRLQFTSVRPILKKNCPFIFLLLFTDRNGAL
jgi:hypothetical protein